MKRMKQFLAVALMACGLTLTAQAQTFDWGITAGMNYSKVKVNGHKEAGYSYSSDNRCGFFFGPKGYLNTVIGLGFDGAIEFSHRRLNIGNESKSYNTLEIPINVRYNFGLGKTLGFYIATGPQFGFAFKNMHWDSFGTGDNFSTNNLYTTWNVGAGLRLLRHLEIGLGYNFALARTGRTWMGNAAGSSTDKELKYRTNTTQLQLTYLF